MYQYMYMASSQHNKIDKIIEVIGCLGGFDGTQTQLKMRKRERSSFCLLLQLPENLQGKFDLGYYYISFEAHSSLYMYYVEQIVPLASRSHFDQEKQEVENYVFKLCVKWQYRYCRSFQMYNVVCVPQNIGTIVSGLEKNNVFMFAPCFELKSFHNRINQISVAALIKSWLQCLNSNDIMKNKKREICI